jgi:hypothetical protein
MGFVRFGATVILILFLVFPTACSVHKKMTVGAAASLVEDIAAASSKQKDLRVIREGMPAYLLLMDGMIEGWPENPRLLIAAAQAYATFATAFVEEADRTYREILLSKAKAYALEALRLRGVEAPQSSPFTTFESDLAATADEDTAYLFWAATAWGNWIQLNIGSMEALAELPRVELMIKRVLALDEGFYYGGAHLFLAILQASRPKIAGGDLGMARRHFLRARDIGQGRFLMTEVYFAQYYARKAFDRDLFVRTLRHVLEQPVDTVPELTLLNTVAHRKAAEMLAAVDEYF